MLSKEILVGGRRIKAEWSQKLVDDLSKYHSIDIREELNNLFNKDFLKRERNKKLNRIF